MHQVLQPPTWASASLRTMVMVPCWMMASLSLRSTMPMWKKPRYSSKHMVLNRLALPERLDLIIAVDHRNVAHRGISPFQHAVEGAGLEARNTLLVEKTEAGVERGAMRF